MVSMKTHAKHKKLKYVVNGTSLDTLGNMKVDLGATIKVKVNKKALLTIVKDSLHGTKLCKSLYNQ